MQGLHSLNKGWLFHLGEVPQGGYKGLRDEDWLPVTLPHDWSVSQPFSQDNSSGTGYLPGGVGWYRRHIQLPQLVRGDRLFIRFGGVYKHARAWFNSNYLGMRAYGYSSFTHEVTEYAIAGHNVLAVRAEHIDLADSRWFTGAGIYRDVSLYVAKAPAFKEHGLFVETLSADQASAQLKVSWQLYEQAPVRLYLRDDQGQVLNILEAQAGQHELTIALDKPLLWSPDTPYLYSLTAHSLRDGQERDSIQVPVGIRTFYFDANEGFFLNGVNMKLKGVCVHHDAGALGAAVPQNVWRRRIEKLKLAGCNALRCSHNPPDSGLLALCDSMGLLVIDEAFDEWEGIKNKWWQGHNVYPPKLYGYGDDFPQWHEQDLRDMVRRDRKHPSIILWSIGNEVDYPNDPYVHPLFDSMTGNNDANKPAQERRYDPNKPNAERLTTVSRRLVQIVKEEDHSRPVTSALAFPELSNLTGYAQTLDVVGYNYKEHLYEEDHQKYPDHIIMGSENGTHAEAWLPVKRLPYISGQFLWTGVDFLGECKGWPVRMSAAGILDAAGFVKPKWALRQALWTETPCLYLGVSGDGNIHEEAFGWHGEKGESKVVACYSNGMAATLSLNGKDLGTQPLDELCRVTWELPYEPGELIVTARWPDGSQLERRLSTAQGPLQLALNPVEHSLPADGQSLWQVEVKLKDAKGQVVTGQDEDVRYEVVGGQLMGIENGHIADLTPYSEQHRKTWQGRAIAYVRAGEQAGELKLTATRLGESYSLAIPLMEAPHKPQHSY